MLREKVLESYKNFTINMKEKGSNTEQISEKRFLKLSTNPQTGHFDEKSLAETIGGLQYKLSGSIKNLRCPENSKVDLDFVAQSTNSGKTIFIDHKQMIDFQTLADTKGINVKHFPSHESIVKFELSTSNSTDVSPGYFSKTIIEFDELLKNDQIKEVIKKRPEKYGQLELIDT